MLSFLGNLIRLNEKSAQIMSVDFCSKVFTRSLVTCFEFFLKFAKFPMKSDSRLKKLEWMGIYLSINESRQLEIYCKQLKLTKIEIGAGFLCRNGCVRLGRAGRRRQTGVCQKALN